MQNPKSAGLNPPKRTVIGVSELNRQAKRLLEGQFDQVWVQGEISNLAKPNSGHWYFTLKDARAQIRCAMFRNRNSMLRFKPGEGDEVIARGRVSIYEGRGDYQLIIDNLQPAGAGALQQQLEVLKAKLLEQGLFAMEAKQDLPDQPQHVAIVSSASGAALQDIISVFKRRAPQILLSVYPVSVQGAESAVQLIEAVESLSTKTLRNGPEIDAVIVARGGGSIEDLWSFNNEQLANAIYNCPIPVVSAVGHETDFTICDLVADVRAPTPSAAAELLSPDSAELMQDLANINTRLQRAMRLSIRSADRELYQVRRLLRHPGTRLEDHAQRCDELSERLQRAFKLCLNQNRSEATNLNARLLAQRPEHALRAARLRLSESCKRLVPAVHNSLTEQGAILAHYARLLHTVSPMATMERGYSIVEVDRKGSPEIARSVKTLEIGDQINARLPDGSVQATITGRKP